MASITIRNLDDEAKTRVRVRAVKQHRSMEEARILLRDGANGGRTGFPNREESTCESFALLGGVRLELHHRGLMREPPEFS